MRIHLRILSALLFNVHFQYMYKVVSKIIIITHCCCSLSQSCSSLHDPRITVCQASLSLTISQSLPKFMSIALVMPSSHQTNSYFFGKQLYRLKSLWAVNFVFNVTGFIHLQKYLEQHISPAHSVRFFHILVVQLYFLATVWFFHLLLVNGDKRLVQASWWEELAVGKIRSCSAGQDHANNL